MSDEVAVMAMEQRGCIKWSKQCSTVRTGGNIAYDKTFRYLETLGYACV